MRCIVPSVMLVPAEILLLASKASALASRLALSRRMLCTSATEAATGWARIASTALHMTSNEHLVAQGCHT